MVRGVRTNPLVLGPMLRYVDDTSATIWVETSRPGEVTVLGHRARTFCVKDRHYALVIVEGLAPASTTEYDVRFDGEVVWPAPDSDLPPSVIRTTGGDGIDLLIGSCRAAAPHEPPYTLELAMDERGRGIDTLWVHAGRMAAEPIDTWPTLLLLIGDQIYADDSSPRTEERIEQTRDDDCDLPSSVVLGFEEYCWLYHEAWSPTLERWLFSVLPAIMIFDDHDVIDDWNISAAWRAEISQEPWWQEHDVGSMMSYWIYQHLGNLSPEHIRTEGLLARLTSVPDGSGVLEAWARAGVEDPGPYRFSYARDLGEVKIVVIDCRHGRVLEEHNRRMVDEDEWSWIRRQALDHHGAHLLLATTLPVFLEPGLHDLQVWNERVCGGAWGRWFARRAEKVRRQFDLEHWPAFGTSYEEFVALLTDLQTADGTPPTTVVASGDIHFSYSARIDIGPPSGRVHQVVTSPIRNALIPPERGVIRFMLSGLGRRAAAALRRLAGRRPTATAMETEAGPFFANNMAVIRYRGADAELVLEQGTPGDDGLRGELTEVARVRL
jgi:hypothetical protein